MSNLFYEILYRPLFNALVFLYQYFSFGDLGVAIILLTILIRLVLFPLFYKGAKDKAIIQRLEPRIKEIQKNHRDDREKQARALLDLYREHRVNPLSGFLLILAQLPILIALYRVFLKGFSIESLSALYSFIPKPETLSYHLFNLIDLSQRDFTIAVFAAVAQYFQGRLALPKSRPSSQPLTPAETMAKQMVYLGPVLTVVFLYFLNLPSAIGLYWLTTSAFSVIQQIVINRTVAKYFEHEGASGGSQKTN